MPDKTAVGPAASTAQRPAVEAANRESQIGKDRRGEVHEGAWATMDGRRDIRCVEQQKWAGLVRPAAAMLAESRRLRIARVGCDPAISVLVVSPPHIDGCDHPA